MRLSFERARGPDERDSESSERRPADCRLPGGARVLCELSSKDRAARDGATIFIPVDFVIVPRG